MEAMRSLILERSDWETVGWGFAVVALAGVVMFASNVRAVRAYD
jgi:hypothetical protein